MLFPWWGCYCLPSILNAVSTFICVYTFSRVNPLKFHEDVPCICLFHYLLMKIADDMCSVNQECPVCLTYMWEIFILKGWSLFFQHTFKTKQLTFFYFSFFFFFCISVCYGHCLNTYLKNNWWKQHGGLKRYAAMINTSNDSGTG